MSSSTLQNSGNGNGNGYIVIPRWFVSFLSFLTSVVFVGAVLWAWSISNDVSAIKAEIKATSAARASELEDLRRRLDRHDLLFDRLLERQALK
ncbi:MAG: hypothetical protein RL215_936 [Planctomycetota bacterium]|jgi:hypothetical protein